MRSATLRIALFLLSLLGSFPIWATHIAGGEIYYEYIARNRYRITMKLYIDCENGEQSAINTDRTAFIAYYNALTNQLIGVDEITRTGPNRVRETNYSCVTNQPSACVDEYTYQFEKDLNPSDHGIILTFQRCCRNGTINNLLNPEALGATYTTTIPATTDISVNSSPIYRKLPPNFLCNDAPLVFDHSATDTDGDSLVYSLVVPYHGASRTSPRPSTPQAPPYQTCVLANPYTIKNLMGGTVQIQIDPKTGELRVTPDKTGQFVVGIRVQEYRNGVLIGEVLRDYQFNVFDCNLATQANFLAPQRVCNDSARFKDLSKSALSYHWDFGLDGVDWDTSNKMQPSWYYQQSGTYKVQLVVSNGSCKDSFYNYVHVILADSIHARISADPDSACGPIRVNIQNTSDPTPYWVWEFGDGSPQLVNSDPGAHIYTNPGVYRLKLTITDSSKCNINDAAEQVIHVFPQPDADFVKGETLCDGLVEFENRSTNSNTYHWKVFATPPDTSYDANPTLEFAKDGNYRIRLIARSPNCVDSIDKFIPIVIIPTLDAKLNIKPLSGCLPLDVFLSYQRTKYDRHDWDFGDGNRFSDTIIKSYRYDSSGTFVLKHIIRDSLSCNLIDSAFYTIRTKTRPGVYFDYDYNPCTGDMQLHNYSTNASDYTWEIGTNVRSHVKEPSWNFDSPQRIQIALTADSASICPVTYVLTAELDRSDLSGLIIPNVFTPGRDGINDCFELGGIDRDCYSVKMEIYNRWGEKVFQSADSYDCWRGTSEFNHKNYPSGTYFARYFITNKSTGEELFYTNTITLIRD
ncbi:MAG: gliding motility-associated C-terminal domain-containing protein [Flavobacteriales bacterium]|nr:gliding motility-associated C-terminal domain-containing protein [Flavobacteriales bacterium]